MGITMVIGITGGVGCGKSTVMSVLEECFHAKTILADELGHQAMRPGEKPYLDIRAAFGREVIRADGQLDRGRLAEIIYADEQKRKQLNDIIHPYVKQKIKEQLSEWQTEPVVAVETAIMFESGCDEFCDQIWYVKADKAVRIKRLMESRGYTREKAEVIMSAQISEEEGCQRCDVCIENNGTIEKIAVRLQELLDMS